MESALIISCSEKATATLTELLLSASIGQITSLQSCAEARLLLSQRDFDLVLINAPLRDETGENLSRYIATSGIAQVILIVKSEYFDEISAITEDDGVFTIAKPISKTVIWAALKLAKAAHGKLKQMQAENRKLKQKIEDIRIVDRAKCILISYLGLSEREAHRHIEKHAMDMRVSKREVAEGLLKTYEN